MKQGCWTRLIIIQFRRRPDTDFQDSVHNPHAQSGSVRFYEQNEGSLNNCWIFQFSLFEFG
jgi:hypothetical protein